MTGCKQTNQSQETTPVATTPNGTTPNTDETTTPDVGETTTTDEPIVTPPEPQTLTLTSVKVTTGTDKTEIYAGSELQAYLVKKGVALAEDGFPIHVSIDSSIGMDCFKIEATLGEGGGMTFTGGNGRGVIYSVYRFLEKYAGFRYLAPGLETQTADAIVITDGFVMEHTPSILARRMCWYSVSGQLDWYIKNGINPPNIPDELGGDYHNYGSYFVHSIAYLAESTYPYPT